MTPLVSVILLTYNHKNYIEQCLESVVNQITDFQFEIIIGDDYSDDGTRLICEEYQNKFQNLITLLPSKKNLGLPDNLIQTLSFAKGKYIAFIEGDDYWTDQYKLQTQYEILETNIEVVAVTHNSEIIADNEYEPLLQNPKLIYALGDSKNGRIFHTNSWFVRKEAIPDFNQYHPHLICWDILMEIKIMEYGNVFCIDKIMSIWRKHEGGNSVKISIKEDYYNFERLYKTLLTEAMHKGTYIKHYRQTLKKFYRIFAFEIVRWDGVLFFLAILKYIIWQFKTLQFDVKFIPELLLTYFKSSRNKNRYTHYK